MERRASGAGVEDIERHADPSASTGPAQRVRLAPLRRTVLGTEFERGVRNSQLIEPGDCVVVAVSGGADSVALLHLLHFLLDDWELRLIAAHFDHAMRATSLGDAAWVAGLCRAWSVPVERGLAEAPLHSEAEAREARYEFLHEVADRYRADRIALAHQADDQAETVLFHAIRGTGLRGLAGIPSRRGRIVRPLLSFRRGEILAYLRAARLDYRIDPTNRSPAFTRNRLRHEVMPVLESIVPGASDSLSRLATHARAEELAWDSALDALEAELVIEATDDRIELARPRLLSYHAELQARVLRRMARRLGQVPDQAGTRSAVEFTSQGTSGTGIDVASGIRVEREFDRIHVLRVKPSAVQARDRRLLIERPGNGEGRAQIGGRLVTVRWTLDHDDGRGDAIALSPERIRFPLEVRAWRPGDRIEMPYGTKKLKKMFGERRVGRTERARVPVLAEVDGRILWVVGVARSAIAESEPGRLRIEVTVTDAEHA